MSYHTKKKKIEKFLCKADREPIEKLHQELHKYYKNERIFKSFPLCSTGTKLKVFGKHKRAKLEVNPKAVETETRQLNTATYNNKFKNLNLGLHDSDCDLNFNRANLLPCTLRNSISQDFPGYYSLPEASTPEGITTTLTEDIHTKKAYINTSLLVPESNDLKKATFSTRGDLPSTIRKEF
jgi:hypothetical protein